MKKHLIVITAIVLFVLMAVPFAMVTSADVTLPDEPEVTNNKVVYFGHGGKGNKDGSNAANFLPTDGWDPVNYPNAQNKYPMYNALKSGGTFVPAGKGYVGATCTIAATDTPVLFTAWDGEKDFTGTIDGTSDSNGNGLPDGQGTQTGMFMIANNKKATFMGDVIFDKITIIDRTKGASVGAPKTTTYVVGSTGRMVIGPDVTITGSHNDVENSLYNPILEVQAGGYAFLHSIGFSKYIGTGVIVVGDEVKGSVTADTFADFDGVVVDKNGKTLFASAPETDAPETDAPGAVELPGKPSATGTKKFYIVYDKTEAGVLGTAAGGATANPPYKTSIAGGWSSLMNGEMADGGTLVGAGKVFIPQTYAFPATTHPIVFTAVDGAKDYTSRDAGGNIKYMNASGNNDGQYGMFMIANGNASKNGKDVIVTFNGDVIFDNIVILSRLTEGQKNNGEYPATIAVKSKLWVKDNVQFANMRGNQNYKLRVDEGAVAYLDAAGFGSYAGTGTIVIGDAIKASVTESMFAGFDGAVVDSQGNPLFAAEPDDTTPPADTDAPADTTPDIPADTTPVELPAKPKFEGTNQQYIANKNYPADPTKGKDTANLINGSADGGASADLPYDISITGGWTKFVQNKLGNGVKIIAAGKVYIPSTFSFPATEQPIMFTANDGSHDFTSRDEEGNPYFMKDDGNNAGQYGMFMIENVAAGAAMKEITFEGDVIFDNIVILSRLTEGGKNNGSTTATIVIKKRLHITDTVQFANMRGNRSYTLRVDEGAFAFLDALGFYKYTGKGTIVIGDAIRNSVTADMFDGFEGKVVDSKGKVIFASGAEEDEQGPVAVPAEPKDAGNFTFYIAYDNNPERDIFGSADGGYSAGHPYKTSISGGWGLMTKNQLKDGGKLVCVGKAYIPASFAFPDTKDPIVFTAVDGGVNYTSRDDKGNIYYMKADGNNDGQYGMFMIVNSTSTAARTITFNGDVIFDNIVILSRVTQGQKNKGEYAATLNINKSIVINSNVKFACMRGNSRYVLNVNEGAFAYLHATGFKKFTGNGTIVIGDELIGKVKAEMFGGFKGRVVDMNGVDLFDVIPDNPPTGDAFNPAFVAIIAVAALTVGAVLTLGVATRRREQY